jgi:predicted CopG family antitoxin
MRTTVDIPDVVYRELKAKALRENRSVKELILRSVEAELRSKSAKKKKRVSLPLVPSKRPGSLEVDNDKIYDLISFP